MFGFRTATTCRSISRTCHPRSRLPTAQLHPRVHSLPANKDAVCNHYNHHCQLSHHQTPSPSTGTELCRRYSSTSTAQNASRSLISLQADGGAADFEGRGDEVTVYIKGFLSQNESNEEFSDWIVAHRRLQRPTVPTGLRETETDTQPASLPPDPAWGPVAMGYTWASGHHADALSSLAFPLKGLWQHSKFALLPLPTITMHVAIPPVFRSSEDPDGVPRPSGTEFGIPPVFFLGRAYTMLKYARRAGSLTPAGLATAASVELAHTVGWQAYKLHRQYKDVGKNIESEARALAAEMDTLATQYKKVRVVGLSLGGLLALEAQAIRTARLLLDGNGGSSGGDPAGTVELHLCGAAVTASRAAQLLSAIQGSTAVTVYHATTDRVLSVFFSFAEGAPSIGEVGVSDDVLATMPNVESIDVSDCLETIVHWDYANKFDKLVRRRRRPHPVS